MSPRIHPRAGQLPAAHELVDVEKLRAAYYAQKPDPAIPSQRVSFGTSGHRGSAFQTGFNENHILAITQAICDHRKARGIDGPLYLGMDTHALSAPALQSALEVLAANGVTTLVDAQNGFTPTPAISQSSAQTRDAPSSCRTTMLAGWNSPWMTVSGISRRRCTTVS